MKGGEGAKNAPKFMKTYFSKDNNYEDINLGFKQTFHHTPSKKVDVSSLIRKKIETDEQITDFDLAILKAIDEMKFVTNSQIARVLNVEPDKTIKRLSKLVKNKLINSFFLGAIKYLNRDEVPEDAQSIFTMDYAGSVFVERFIKNKFEEWQCKDAALNPISIGKILISNEFYANAKNSIGENLKSYVDRKRVV